MEVNIGGELPILIFMGWHDGCDISPVTIISIQGPKPEIIFNKQIHIVKFAKNGSSSKIIICEDYNFFYANFTEGKVDNPKVPNPYKNCKEIYIENNELKVVPCTRTLADDEREEAEEKSKTN